jgi:pimeloyl-ACP methyl ester carboxylesterase
MNSRFTSQVAHHDGYATHYLEARPASGEHSDTVLLVHDGWFGADAATLWAAVIELLATDHRVLAPDMLGFGGTDKAVYFDRSMYAYRGAHLASFTRAVCEPGEALHAVGTSMGGSVLVRDVAAEQPRIPARSVLSISGSGGPWRSAFGAQELGRFDGTAEDIERVLDHMADEFDGREAVLQTRFLNSQIRGHAECLLTSSVRHPSLSRSPQPDSWPAPLAGVRVPVTFLAGARDPLLEPGWEQHLTGLSPLVEVSTLDSKHAPSLDHAEDVVQAIRQNIARARALATGIEAAGVGR